MMPALPLRGADKLAREGGDLDFVVPPGFAATACKVVATVARAEGWFVLQFRDVGYLAQIVLVNQLTGTAPTAFKIDFFDGVRWYGVGRDIVGDGLFASPYTLGHNETKLGGALNFLQKMLVVGRLSDRDWARVVATGVDADYLTEFARMYQLPLTRSQIEARAVSMPSKWRLRAASGGARDPVSALAWFARACMAHLKFKLRFGTTAGLILGVSGLDGAGKSTIVDWLIDAHRRAGSEQPCLVHLLPPWIPFPHQILRRRRTRTTYDHPYLEPPVRSNLNGGLRLAYYLCAFMLTRLSLWLGAIRGRLFILDRSFLDFASDLTRARIPDYPLPKWLLRACCPKGLLLFIDVPPEQVVVRKGELSSEKAIELRERYLRTCNEIGRVHVIDGSASPKDVIKSVLQYIDAAIHVRMGSVGTG
ncbi:MAG: hypothetical protein AB7G75_33615 [Candidatus Binatia bacterium]